MRTDEINEKTVKILLDRYGYYFYVIKRIPDTKCTCVDPMTKDPDLSCKKCLGLGTRVKIKKVYGVIREARERETSVAQNISSTPKIVYIDGLEYVNKDDVVIDSENVYNVLHIQYHRGGKGSQQFTRLVCPNRKSNTAKLAKNFKEVLNEHKLRKK